MGLKTNLAVDEVDAGRVNSHRSAPTFVLQVVSDVASPVRYSPGTVDKSSILIIILTFATTSAINYSENPRLLGLIQYD